NGELITLTRADARDKYFPNAGRAQRAHGVLRGIPPTEISDHGDTFGVRGPHRKSSTGNLAELRRVGLQVGAEYFPQAFVAAFRNQVQIQRAQGRQKTVAISNIARWLRRVGNAQPIVLVLV